MGQLLEKTLKDFKDSEPITPDNANKCIREDPRSPSSGIKRTPIVTDRTPQRTFSCTDIQIHTDFKPEALNWDCGGSPHSPAGREKVMLRKTNSVPENLHKRLLRKQLLQPPVSCAGSNIYHSTSEKIECDCCSPTATLCKKEIPTVCIDDNN